MSDAGLPYCRRRPLPCRPPAPLPSPTLYPLPFTLDSFLVCPCCRPWSRLATTGPGGHQRGTGWNRHDGFGREMYRMVGRSSRGFERKSACGARGGCGASAGRASPARSAAHAGGPAGVGHGWPISQHILMRKHGWPGGQQRGRQVLLRTRGGCGASAGRACGRGSPQGGPSAIMDGITASRRKQNLEFGIFIL